MPAAKGCRQAGVPVACGKQQRSGSEEAHELIDACLPSLLRGVRMYHVTPRSTAPAVQAMAAVWGEGEHTQCIHPVSGVIAGRDDVSQLTPLPCS